MMEHRSFGIDPQRARELQTVAQEITTKFSDGEEFIDSAVGYFMNMWTNPGVLRDEFISYSKHMKQKLRDQFKAYGTVVRLKIEKEEKKIPGLIDVGFELMDSYDFRCTLGNNRCERIDEIFNENEKLVNYLGGRTIKGFLNESIDMFVLLWTDFPKVYDKFHKIYSYLPLHVITYWKENFPEEFARFELEHNNWKKQNKYKKQVINNPTNTNEFNEFAYEFKKNAEEIEVEVRKKIINKVPYVLPRSNQALISQFNTRIFPAKLGVVILANMINNNNGEPINYEAYQKKFFNVAKDLSEKLKLTEKEYKLKRNQKFSTGLPIADKEQESSKKRFLEYYVGTPRKKWIKRQLSKKEKQEKSENGLAYFDGALNSFGLAYFMPKYDGVYPTVDVDGKCRFKGEKLDNFQIQIGITKKGLDFALMPNPIIDDLTELQLDRGKWKKPLSKKESIFIKNQIMTEFPLEKLLIEDVKTEITALSKKHDKCESCDSNSHACSHLIDDVFQKLFTDNWNEVVISENKINKEKGVGERFSDIPKWLFGDLDKGFNEDETIQLVHWRTALIGRLSELGEVEWKIATIETGKIHWGTSYYAIPK